MALAGLMARGPPLGGAADIATAKATCAKLSACYLISVSGEDGSARLSTLPFRLGARARLGRAERLHRSARQHSTQTLALARAQTYVGSVCCVCLQLAVRVLET